LICHYFICNILKFISYCPSLKFISKYVIIKDHFEYGYFSRQILRLGDWFGNYGTDINIPKKYFTEFKWKKLIKKLKLNQIKMINNVKQHKFLFSLILSSKHQFISVIKN
jgi:hypothetical protein